jgi:hypothetical protein
MNSREVFVMVLYTGKDTKLFLNQGEYKFKISKLSYMLNIFLVINLVIVVIIMMSGFIGNLNWMKENSKKHFYIFPEINFDNY